MGPRWLRWLSQPGMRTDAAVVRWESVAGKSATVPRHQHTMVAFIAFVSVEFYPQCDHIERRLIQGSFTERKFGCHECLHEVLSCRRINQFRLLVLPLGKRITRSQKVRMPRSIKKIYFLYKFCLNWRYIGDRTEQHPFAILYGSNVR